MARFNSKSPKKSNATGFFIFSAVIALGIGAVGSYYQFRFKNTPDMPTFKTGGNGEVPSVDATKPTAEVNILTPAQPEADPNSYTLKDLKSLPLPTPLPELLNSDESFRKALLAISPNLAPWLNADHLIRKLLLIANDMYQGIRVSRNLSFMRLELPFSVEQTDLGMSMSERSYHRFDKLAEAVNVINPKALALTYQAYRPLAQQVFNELGYPKEVTLEAMIKKMAADILDAPVLEGRVELTRPSVLYKFADPALEALSPAQKQLIRMGPANTRVIQAKLRAFMVEFAALKPQ
jgi:Protein of unknown function (DUF3014)